MDAAAAAAAEEAYQPNPEFQPDDREPLTDLNLTDSTELWLIQWPLNEIPDIDGKEVTLNLQPDGCCLGSFQSSSGKEYDVVTCATQDPDATVFLNSSTETRIVGKISRRVSLVHYAESEELQEQEARKLHRTSYEMAAGTSMRRYSHYSATPTKSRNVRASHSPKVPTSSMRSSRHKSSMFEGGEESNARKKRRTHEATGSSGRLTMDS